MNKVIAVIDPAIHRCEVECFNDLVLHSPLPLHYHMPALRGMQSLHIYKDQTLSLAGIIVLGSAASVNDNFPWQAEFHPWLKKQMEKNIPTLGICYGHQLVAHLYGAPVRFIDGAKTKQKCFRNVRLTANPLWGKAQEGELFISHAEMVAECPEGFDVTASCEAFPLYGLHHREKPIWTFQPHPESIPAFLRNQEYSYNAYQIAQLAFGNALVYRFLNFCKIKID